MLAPTLEPRPPGARTALDLTAPAGLRPFVLAAARGPGRPAGARGHRDRPRGRGPAAALRGLLAPRGRRRVPVLGDAAARAALARARTPSAGGSPCCAGSPTPTRTTRAPGRSRSSSRRSARVLQPLVAGLGDLEPVALRAGDEIEPRRRSSSGWSSCRYARVDLVEQRGEFAVRGGILDVFPPTEEHPLRVEFWGDTVEEIR